PQIYPIRAGLLGLDGTPDGRQAHLDGFTRCRCARAQHEDAVAEHQRKQKRDCQQAHRVRSLAAFALYFDRMVEQIEAERNSSGLQPFDEERDAGVGILQQRRELRSFLGRDVVAKLARKQSAGNIHRGGGRRLHHVLIRADAEDGLCGMLRGVCFAVHGRSVRTWGAGCWSWGWGWGCAWCCDCCDCTCGFDCDCTCGFDCDCTCGFDCNCTCGFDCDCTCGFDCDCTCGFDCDCTCGFDCNCTGGFDCGCTCGFDCGCTGDCV